MDHVAVLPRSAAKWERGQILSLQIEKSEILTEEFPFFSTSKDNQGIMLLGRMVKSYSTALYLGRNVTVTIQLENFQEVFQKGYNPFQR